MSRSNRPRFLLTPPGAPPSACPAVVAAAASRLSATGMAGGTSLGESVGYSGAVLGARRPGCRANGDDGAVRLAHDLIGHAAAEQQAADGGPGLAGHHDHVGAPPCRM